MTTSHRDLNCNLLTMTTSAFDEVGRYCAFFQLFLVSDSLTDGINLKYQLLQTAVNSRSNHYKLSSQLLYFLSFQSVSIGDFDGFW